MNGTRSTPDPSARSTLPRRLARWALGAVVALAASYALHLWRGSGFSAVDTLIGVAIGTAIGEASLRSRRRRGEGRDVAR